MNGNELESALGQDPHAAAMFHGVYACDTLPLTVAKLPALFIVNTDSISKPGSHWQAIYIDCERRGEFFDSYGLPPYVPQHVSFLKKTCKSYKYNHTDLQALNSSVCGQYCAMFLLFKSHGYSMNYFVKYFSSDCEKNDVLVNKMFKRYTKSVKFCNEFGVKMQSCCKRKRK